jgi:hypothetical protein
MTGLVENLPNGVAVYQTTDNDAIKSNIYCEFPWCAPDSHCFVYQQSAPEHAPNTHEYIACDFGSWEKRVIGHGSGGQTMSGGRFYFQRIGDNDRREFVRVDLMNGEEFIWEIPDAVPQSARLDISCDERYIAYSVKLSWSPQNFGIGLLDLHSGESNVICEDRWLNNSHLQFEPGKGRQLLIQHNRGSVYTPDGKCEVLVGPEGCTLFLLDVPNGNITRLPLGPPDTPSCSGHEAWLGESGTVILTLNIAEDYDHGKGPIMLAEAGKPARQLCAPWEMNHIGSVPSARLFCADTFHPDEIIIGSPYTNKAAVVCAAQTSYQRQPYDSHPHAYLSPDLKWVIFNSDRSGGPQVYCAAVPLEMITELEDDA